MHGMRLPVAVFALAWLPPGSVRAQPQLPASPTTITISARSRTVTIIDGLHVKKDYWSVMPERNPDVYYVEIPRHPHTVTFTTDVDSISFQTTYGSRHDFVIALEDGTRAHTQIRAEYRNLLPYRRTRDSGTSSPTIPFSLRDNDKIYVKGRINEGPELDVQVDLGAGGGLVNHASLPRLGMRFDTKIRLRNSDGDNEVASSSSNRLEIAGLVWDAVPFAVARNMTPREDAIVGNALFQDKVLEIDYDHATLTVHDAPPPRPGWTSADMVLDGVVPFVRGTLAVDEDVRHGWFMLDTGAYTSILNTDRLGRSSKIAGELRRSLGGRAGGPAVGIAGRTFEDINYSVNGFNGNREALGLLGNDVLKRFNLVLNNRSGTAYFHINGRVSDPFRNPEHYLVRVLSIAAAAMVTMAAWLWRRRRRRSRPSVGMPNPG